jgi:hypothetical protein
MDTGANAEIEYHIQKGAYDDFQIDNTTGVIVVASKLDFDRRNTYNIEVTAKDHGEPSLTGTTTLTVSVNNTNDKTPYFIPTTQKAEVITIYLLGILRYCLFCRLWKTPLSERWSTL